MIDEHVGEKGFGWPEAENEASSVAERKRIGCEFWIWILAPPFVGCESFKKSHHLFEPLFPHFQVKWEKQ